VNSNLAPDEVYSMQHHAIIFVSDLRQVGGFLQVLWFTSTNKTDIHDVAEILLNVALKSIILTITPTNALHEYNKDSVLL